MPGRADQTHEARAFAATLMAGHPRVDEVLLAADDWWQISCGMPSPVVADVGEWTSPAVAYAAALLAGRWGGHGNDRGCSHRGLRSRALLIVS